MYSSIYIWNALQYPRLGELKLVAHLIDHDQFRGCLFPVVGHEVMLSGRGESINIGSSRIEKPGVQTNRRSSLVLTVIRLVRVLEIVLRKC